MLSEVYYRYVWILVFYKKYQLLIEKENGIEVMKKLSENPNIESYVKI
jgi:hypothetical protein